MLLLTGATGTAGSLIAREFINQRESVRLLVRDRAKAQWLANVPTVEIVSGDMSDRSSLTRALEGVERALMISSPAMNMVDTQSTFVDACKSAGVRQVIKFSGLDARPETRFPFGRMHWEIEQHLERSGLAWTHLRPTGFMQEYLREAPSIINDGTLYLPLADVRLNPVDLVDVAKIAFLLLRDGGHEGETLSLTGPEALTMTAIAEHISSAVGKAVRYVPISAAQRRQALIAHGVPAEFADALDEQVTERLKGGLESKVDLSTHRRFNVRPTTFSQFARRNAQAFGVVSAAA
jgi:uncharacterized protein YbjT (DUF2867 family)